MNAAIDSQKQILKAVQKKLLPKQKILHILKNIYTARFLDIKLSKLVKQNKGTTFFLSTMGHEMIGAVAADFLTVGKDWCYPYHRDRSFVVALGAPLLDIMGAFLARASLHHSAGKMMPDHFCDKDRRILCQSSCVGSQLLQAVGTALSVKLNGSDDVVYVSAGDGATSQGDFHESLNFAALHKLGIIFVIQDNGWAISVPVKEQTAGGSIVNMAKGYQGLEVYEIDGCSYLESSFAMEKAVQRARNKEGPTLIVAKVVRLGNHSCSDDQTKYKSAEVLDEEKKRDPLVNFENWILKKKMALASDLEKMKADIEKLLDETALETEKIPLLDVKEATEDLFIPFTVEEKTSDAKGAPINIVESLNKALFEEMERDEGVVVFGEDVALKGGVFGVTKGLTARFGNNRCFNTPLAESTIIGVAIGLGMDGKHKPVVEIQYADYIWSGMNQLVNELPSMYYRSHREWSCPIVVRMPYGGYIQGGPYHSQSPETIFCHIPGFKVVVPSNAFDAKRLLKTAIRDPNPVIFLEHKALYRKKDFCEREEASSEELLPFGKANIVKEGADITVIAWGMMVIDALAVANELAGENISVEVIDLRTLVPLDIETILSSLKKTTKVIVVHEACKNCGFGAEIVSRIMEEGFQYLDAPVKRVAGQDVPMPYAKHLEDAVLPQRPDIKKAILDLVSF
jgi:2-oxoisovalerate dehydrogenase E1 component